MALLDSKEILKDVHGSVIFFTDGNMGAGVVLAQIAEMLEPAKQVPFLLFLNELDIRGGSFWEYYLEHAFPDKPEREGGEPDLEHFVQVVIANGQQAEAKRFSANPSEKS